MCIVLGICVLALCGCGKKADENKPLGEVKAEAETMNVGQLREAALSYKDAILSKQDELAKLAAELQEIPIANMLGQEAKSLKSDIEGLNASVSALKSRFDIYYNKLSEKGGDLSSLGL